MSSDAYLTPRGKRLLAALVLAAAGHAITLALVDKIEPEVKQKPIAMSIRSVPPPPPPPPKASPQPEEPKKTSPKARPKRAPVAPELPPSPEPPENRAILPVVEVDPDPTPDPSPAPDANENEEPSWEDNLRSLLAKSTPDPVVTPRGPLAPTSEALRRVAAADPRLYDKETERRMMNNNGAFFRRGLEALRNQWRPQDVLDQSARSARKCSRKTRKTFAVAILDKEGHVVDVELREPSGCPELDEEAVEAFKRVARFPHPPADIFFRPDGTETETARYPVHFVVTFNGGFRLDWPRPR